MLDGIGNIIGDWLDGLGNLIGDKVGDLSELLSSIVGLIPRGIVFIRSLLTPITTFIEEIFGSSFLLFGTSAIFLAVLGFIVALGIRRGVVK